MAVSDPERAIAFWRHSVIFYDEFRDTPYWPMVERHQRLVTLAASSPHSRRYFTCHSHGHLGISTHPTWEEQRVAPMLWVRMQAESGGECFEFTLFDRNHRTKEVRRSVRESDAFQVLEEWLVKLDAEPGA